MIFVFGSNKAGRHGKGAALYAARKYGAIYGVGEGRTGDAYAIPTKGMRLEQLTLEEIAHGIHRFIEYARLNHDLTFLLTPIGTGLAGHSKKDIWAILAKEALPVNVVLSASWVNDK